MTIALFSDIHANLRALEAFFASVETRHPDAWYCLGDLVGYHLQPNVVIQAITSRRIPTIAGNHDAKVQNLKPADLVATSGKNYVHSLIGESEKVYLAGLEESPLPAEFADMLRKAY